MSYSLLQAEFIKAVTNPENVDTHTGEINWNYVDADCYMEVGHLYNNDVEFYERFNDLADQYEMNKL